MSEVIKCVRIETTESADICLLSACVFVFDCIRRCICSTVVIDIIMIMVVRIHHNEPMRYPLSQKEKKIQFKTKANNLYLWKNTNLSVKLLLDLKLGVTTDL